MVMPVMNIREVLVAVLQGAVPVKVLMALRQVQPDTHSH